jgi:glycosyltransferase involved in cell wall biosynthesis
MEPPENVRSKKVAIVHDWLYGGGAERVVLELHRMFPDAPIYTSYCSDEWRAKLDGKVVTGYLQRWPFSNLRKILPVLRIKWFESLDFSGYDLVISSSGNGEAKGIKVPEGSVHVNYCHSPTHFYWRHYDQYLARPGFGVFNPIIRLALKLLVGPLRKWDLKAAQRPHHFIANSTHIQADIKKYYDRDSTVIFPPVDVERFANLPSVERKGFVTVGRQVPQKHTEIVVQACTKLDLPLLVLGRGPEHDNLVKLAGPSVTFKTDASDEEVARAMSGAQAFIFAALDDFGITPIEAMAAGTPVIAYRAGGALDYVEPGVTGEFFDEQTADSLATTLQAFDASAYDPKAIRQRAGRFSATEFQRRLLSYLESVR